MEHDCEGESDGIISVSLYADRLGASTGLAGFCFMAVNGRLACETNLLQN